MNGAAAVGARAGQPPRLARARAGRWRRLLERGRESRAVMTAMARAKERAALHRVRCVRFTGADRFDVGPGSGRGVAWAREWEGSTMTILALDE